MRPLALLVFLGASSLSLKTAFDLWGGRDLFPAWFVPLFAAGQAGLVAYAAWAMAGVWRAGRTARLGEGRIIWLLPLSFVCTSSVHQLYPFRPSVVAVWGGLDPVLRLNLVLTGAAFLASAALALLYRSGLRERAVQGLLMVGLLVLVPNDACANPFNDWWIDTVGASPLMFVPNLYASLFVLAALLGVRPRWNTAAAVAVCAGVALLGLGHATRVIW